MQTIKFLAWDSNGPISTPDNTLAQAVLTAAAHDGYGAEFARDESGEMRLFSSPRHIGNNVYFREPKDAFIPSSKLADDQAAIAEVAEQMRARGVLHSRFQDIEIKELTITDGVLTYVDGVSVEQIAADMDDDKTAEDVRAWYGF